ncbi:MAG TPA: CDP-diacylglycerol--glycerol-3-phosphate 3-phosphatidyltransferase [Candidatus Fraserbacteria bacterium]|nr:CDP-diacylglycerol--glycerol-3-phosphate 3-phosphatidyltransferase [Candidatus Fraserbacteria bacterium]
MPVRRLLPNLPNLITLTRIAIIPVFLLFLLTPLPAGGLIALILFALAALSDAIDGWVARSWEQVTDFGKFADPLADKLLVMAALIVFVARGQIGVIPVIIILSREFLVMGLRILAMTHALSIPASPLAKLKTVSHIGLAVILIGEGAWVWPAWGEVLRLVFVYLAVALALLSAGEYFYRSRHLFHEL